MCCIIGTYPCTHGCIPVHTSDASKHVHEDAHARTRSYTMHGALSWQATSYTVPPCPDCLFMRCNHHKSPPVSLVSCICLVICLVRRGHFGSGGAGSRGSGQLPPPRPAMHAAAAKTPRPQRRRRLRTMNDTRFKISLTSTTTRNSKQSTINTIVLKLPQAGAGAALPRPLAFAGLRPGRRGASRRILRT